MTPVSKEEMLRNTLRNNASILDNRSKREVRQIAKLLEKVQSKKTTARFDSNGLTTESGAVTLIRIFDLYKEFAWSSKSPDMFIQGARRIVEADSISEFEKLDPKIQQKVWDLHYLMTDYVRASRNPVLTCTDKAYIKLLLATGFPVQVMISSTPQVVKKYIEEANQIRNAKNLPKSINHKIDYSLPTDEFLQDAQVLLKTYYRNSLDPMQPKRVIDGITLEPYQTQILLMLRALYGEASVLALLERFSTCDTLLCPKDMITILDEWDKLQEYPADWIGEFHHLDHSRYVA